MLVVALAGLVLAQSRILTVLLPEVALEFTEIPARIELERWPTAETANETTAQVCFETNGSYIEADLLKKPAGSVLFLPLTPKNTRMTLQPAPCPQPPDQTTYISDTPLEYRVHGGAGFEARIPKTLFGLIRSAKLDNYEFFRPGSLGLVLYFHGAPIGAGLLQTSPALQPETARIDTLQNRVLVFSTTIPSPEGNLVNAEMEIWFPGTKPWVDINWTLTGSAQSVTALGLDLNLSVELGIYPTLLSRGTALYRLDSSHAVIASVLEAPFEHLFFELVPDSRIVLRREFTASEPRNLRVRLAFLSNATEEEVRRTATALNIQPQVELLQLSSRKRSN